MNADPTDNQSLTRKTRQHESVKMNFGDQSVDVPVFNCIVYVSRDAGGGVRARVANLAGIGCIAASEREALGKIVSDFKQLVGGMIHAKTQVPWIEPPSPAEPEEQKRFIPVHL